MTQENKINEREWSVFTQAINDALGYPKSDENQKQLGYSNEELRVLFDDLIKNQNKLLSENEKQIILNCIDGAIDYVGTDIPSLYDISEHELRDLKEDLEKRWNKISTYK